MWCPGIEWERVLKYENCLLLRSNLSIIYVHCKLKSTGVNLVINTWHESKTLLSCIVHVKFYQLRCREHPYEHFDRGL